MTLRTVLFWHAISAAPFALVLLLAPQWLVYAMTGEDLTRAGVDFTRLYGAACVLITILAWTAHRSSDLATRVLVSRAFFYYETLGLAIGLGVHFDAPYDLGRWLTIAAYGLFSALYGYVLFARGEGRAESEAS